MTVQTDVGVASGGPSPSFLPLCLFGSADAPPERPGLTHVAASNALGPRCQHLAPACVDMLPQFASCVCVEPVARTLTWRERKTIGGTFEQRRRRVGSHKPTFTRNYPPVGKCHFYAAPGRTRYRNRFLLPRPSRSSADLLLSWILDKTSHFRINIIYY